MADNNQGIINTGSIGGNVSNRVNVRTGDEIHASNVRDANVGTRGNVTSMERSLAAATGDPARASEIAGHVERLRMTLGELQKEKPGLAIEISKALDDALAKTTGGGDPKAIDSSLHRFVDVAKGVSTALPIALKIGTLIAGAFGLAL